MLHWAHSLAIAKDTLSNPKQLKAGIVLTLPLFMKAKTLKKDKVNIITLGCSKNMVDSEVLSGQLMANDIDVVHENAKRDHNIVIVNTCGFIDKAKEESVNTILSQVQLKQKSKTEEEASNPKENRREDGHQICFDPLK